MRTFPPRSETSAMNFPGPTPTTATGGSTPTPDVTVVGVGRPVVVVIVPDDTNVTRRGLLATLFTGAPFTVIDQTPLRPTGSTSDPIQWESDTIRHALRTARNLDPLATTLVIKDSSVSLASPATIAEIVGVCNSNSRWDLCYLCKWNDRCHLYDSVPLHEGLPVAGISPTEGRESHSVLKPYAVVQTRSPGGLQAVMYSPHGRDVILGLEPMSNGGRLVTNYSLSEKIRDEIYNGHLRAHCVTPNVFQYDTILNAMTNADFLKLNECRPIEVFKKPCETGPRGAIWLICILLIIMVVVWLALRVLSRYKSK